MTMKKKACRILYLGPLAALLHYLLNLIPIMLYYFRSFLQPLDEQTDVLRRDEIWTPLRDISTVNLQTFAAEVIAFSLMALALWLCKEKPEESGIVAAESGQPVDEGKTAGKEEDNRYRDEELES